MNIYNYTPHRVSIISNNQTTIFEPKGLARVSEKCVVIGKMNGIDICKMQYSDVTGLPPENNNDVYIVSSIVANALKGKRNDIYVPCISLRDKDGRIIGCEKLAKL